MSMQFHESSINNLLDRVEIKGRKFTAQELTQHLQDVFRSEQAAGSGEVNHEAQFEFAPYDPLRVSFNDNEVELQLNFLQVLTNHDKRQDGCLHLSLTRYRVDSLLQGLCLFHRKYSFC